MKCCCATVWRILLPWEGICRGGRCCSFSFETWMTLVWVCIHGGKILFEQRLQRINISRHVGNKVSKIIDNAKELLDLPLWKILVRKFQKFLYNMSSWLKLAVFEMHAQECDPCRWQHVENGLKNLAHGLPERVKVLKTMKLNVHFLSPNDITIHGKCWFGIQNPILDLSSRWMPNRQNLALISNLGTILVYGRHENKVLLFGRGNYPPTWNGWAPDNW